MQGLKKLSSTGRKGNRKKIGPSPSSPFLLHLTERNFFSPARKYWKKRNGLLEYGAALEKVFFCGFFNSLSHMQVCNILRRKLAIDGRGRERKRGRGKFSVRHNEGIITNRRNLWAANF